MSHDTINAKQGSCWYNRVGDLIMSLVWDGRKEFYTLMDEHARSIRMMPHQSVRPIALATKVHE